MSNETPNLYDDAVAAGIPCASHESDLYLPDTPAVRELAKKHKANGYTFISNVDGKPWIDFPFLFMPFWRSRTAGVGTPT